MDLPRVPPALIGGIAELPSLFVSLAHYRGVARSVAEEIAVLVPEAIRRAPCFLDRLTGLWRYDFGQPFVDLPNDGVVLSTSMYPPVDRLFDVVGCAQRRLTPRQLSDYLIRLGNPAKHEDLLFEFAPILRLPPTIKTTYEVAGYGDGNRTVDWLIEGAAGPPIAMDVKNRVKDLLDSLVRVQAGERAPDGRAPEPVHDPAMLFSSLEKKFQPRAPNDVVQTAWIGTELKQEEDELATAFARLDPRRIHVVFLGDWNEDVYVLSNDAAARLHACEVLRVRESRRFVFRRRTEDDPEAA